MIEEVLEKLQAVKFYAVLDSENGFFHVPVEKISRAYTAFVTREGPFELNKGPFGFRSCPAAYKKKVVRSRIS